MHHELEMVLGSTNLENLKTAVMSFPPSFEFTCHLIHVKSLQQTKPGEYGETLSDTLWVSSPDHKQHSLVAPALVCMQPTECASTTGWD